MSDKFKRKFLPAACLVALALIAGILYISGLGPRTADPTVSLKVTNVHVGSNREYQVVHHGFVRHTPQYVDRHYRYCRIPQKLTGATFIRTANEDRTSEGISFLDFSVNQPVTVYIAHDNRLGKKPKWLRRFKRVDLVLESDDRRSMGFDLYKRRFSAGTVNLGGNTTAPTLNCMYSVLVVPHGCKNLPPVADVGVDMRVRMPDLPLQLSASVEDDGGTAMPLTHIWSCEDIGADVTFSEPNALSPTVNFTQPGTYTLRFTASDGDKTVFDSLQVQVLRAAEPFELARRNAVQAREGWIRCNRFLEAWLKHRDKRTGLIPRDLRGLNIWNAKDCAADCYPFMVLTAEMTAPEHLKGACMEMLEAERRITARIDSLPDQWSLGGQKFVYDEPDMARIQFGASEYIKDGLIAITEWMGESPWNDRMFELVHDCWKNAQVDTPFGKIVATNIENNGEMLQVLPRLYWMTGDAKYLDWALRLADYYLLGTHHPTRDLKQLRLRDHGCEVLSGLCEVYATCYFARPEKYAEYKAPLYEMLDRILEVARTPDGMFYDNLNAQTGEVLSPIVGDNFGYNYNGYYTVYMIDGHEAYREEALKTLRTLNRYPSFHGAEPMDGHCDAIEGVLYFLNREPLPWLHD